MASPHRPSIGGGFVWTGNLTTLDLIAASVNSLEASEMRIEVRTANRSEEKG